MSYINFVILNSRVTNVHLRFIKSTYFYWGKTEKLEIAVFPRLIYLLINMLVK